MQKTTGKRCAQESEDDTMDTDVTDDMEYGEAVNYLLEIAIKKRRRFTRRRKGRDRRTDCIQKRFIKKLCDEIEKILKEREEEDLKASMKQKPTENEQGSVEKNN